MKKIEFHQKNRKAFFLMLLLFFMSNPLFATTSASESDTAFIPDFVQEHQALLWILGVLIFVMILILLTKQNEPLSE
ncbi:MAG: hypothetical protein IE931_13945 [Sphingobacteriales bacterium]|nr:hypothetical protein [Sphingobacteriales bacterium]